ncbi:RadC family protein [Sphingoaurantiacus capsulatus]|uniref:RadC family protein n=1 Tax=Sphingoaurantiacus capsulatus TaxID=1771310 RepID=A0ABV7XDW6_9SPHN
MASVLSVARSFGLVGSPAVDPDASVLTELFEAAGGGATSADVAKRLLDETGSLGGAMAATVADLARLGVPQEARRAIAALRAAVTASLKRTIEDRPCLASSRSLLDYLHADMAFAAVERFRVLFLNNKNVLIRDEVMSEGSLQTAPVHVREVVKRALDLGAAALILVHNHTSGDPRPSQDDIDITREMMAAAGLFGIAVHDHIVIGRQGHASLGQLGYLK